MTRRWLSALAATMILLAVCAGVPVTLARWGRWPISGMPTIDHVRDLPNSIVSDAAVFGLLTIAAWTIWLLFMVSVVRELWAQGLGRDLGRGPVPPVLHRYAARLVGAVLMTASVIGPATRSTAMPTPSAIVSAESQLAAPVALTPSTVSESPEPDATTTSLPEIEVRRGDNPWDLATSHLGDPLRWRELFELNRGRPQPDGSAWTVPDVIEPGWRLRLPANATIVGADPPEQYTVLPGDSLSKIARDQLGSIERYPEIFDRNAGRPQADGESLTDPDLIQPGWVLDLSDVGPASTAPPEPEIPGPPPSQPTSSLPPATSGPAAPPLPPTTPPTEPPLITTPPPLDGESAPSEHGTRVPVGLVGGGVATAGLLALLERRRRAGIRRRQPESQPTPLAPATVLAEQRLRAGVAPDHADRVDGALRAINAHGRDARSTPRLVEVDESSVRVHGTDDAPEALFVATADGAWETTADAPSLDRAGRTAPPPSPGLCPVGVGARGRELLVDLAANPISFIEAHDSVRRGVLQSMAVALSTAPWVVSPSIVTIGLTAMPDVDVRGFDELQAALNALESEPRIGSKETRQVTVVLSNVQPATTDAIRLRRLGERGVVLVCPPADGYEATLRVRCDESGAAEVVTDGSQPLEVVAHSLADSDVVSINDLMEHATAGFKVKEPAGREVDLRDDEAAVPPRRVKDAMGDLDVLVNVLGEVNAEHVHGDERARISVAKQRSLEAITYIALRESSVDREDVQAALWPDGSNSAKTFANAIWEARRVLGLDRDGLDLLPEATEGRYTLSPRVGTDYSLFCELVEAADGMTSPNAAIDLLTEALELVRGEPFIGVGRSYSWVGPHRGMIATQVLDAAESLAEIRLAAGDWRGAEWAARRGLRAMPCDERMYRLLMRAAHASGNTAAVHRTFKELCEVLADPDDGAEPIDTVHPETVSLMEDLTSAARSARVIA